LEKAPKLDKAEAYSIQLQGVHSEAHTVAKIFPGRHIFDPQARVAEVVEKVIDDNATSSSTEQCTRFCPHFKPCRRSMDIHLQSLSQCHNCLFWLTRQQWSL